MYERQELEKLYQSVLEMKETINNVINERKNIILDCKGKLESLNSFVQFLDDNILVKNTHDSMNKSYIKILNTIQILYRINEQCEMYLYQIESKLKDSNEECINLDFSVIIVMRNILSQLKDSMNIIKNQ
jgi:hypothetical protein